MSQKDRNKLFLIGIIAISLGGCDFFKVEYTSLDDNGYKYSIRYKFDGNNLKLLDTRTFGNKKFTYVDTWFDDCKIFDEKNWSCRSTSAFTSYEKVEMVDGVILWDQAGEVRTYKKTYKFELFN